MKTLLSYLAVAGLILTSSFTVNEQQQLNRSNQSVTSCFSRFNVHRAGKAAIEVTWTVSNGNISQFIVERSYDGEFFESVTTIEFNGSSSYKSKDHDVYPGMIYYRVTAMKTDGTSECSPVEMVRIVQRG